MRHSIRLSFAPLLVALALAGCAGQPEPEISVGSVAESFVKLALALGQHDADYVDAYLGPEAWREEARAQALTVDDIRARARAALAELRRLEPPTGDETAALRQAHLDKTLESLIARADQLGGLRMSFDEESRALYDAEAPRLDADHFQSILDRLETELPGDGPLGARYEAFKEEFLIPTDRLDGVFAAAIEACRRSTREWIELPEGESFEIEYVTDKSWSGYNWYKGSYHSLIQVNTDLPIAIDRALDLACHEGYPGHHVYNLLAERDLVRGRGWVEFTVYPLFSPRSLIAEGTANYGIAVAFPGDERAAFERDTLYPLAGLDASRAEEYDRVRSLMEELGYAGNEAARRYLDGDIDADAAVAWLETYALMSPQRARQRLRFIEQYRSYVINYNLGEDIVRSWVERQGGGEGDPARRWQLFAELLQTPRLPSQLVADAP